MAFSWGGFARTLNDNITKDRDAEREEASFAKRARMQKELEKEFAADVIARTAIVGDREVMYNSRGDIVTERFLTPEELAEKKAALDKTLADTRAATATAGITEKNLNTYDERFSLDKQQTQAAIDSSRASAYASRVNADTNRAQLDLMRASNGGLPKELAKEYDEVVTMISATPADGINSPEATMQTFEAGVNAALAEGNVNEARRLIAQVKGQIYMRYKKAETQATTRGYSFGLDNTGNLAPPTGVK